MAEAARDLPVPGPPVKTRFFQAGRLIAMPAFSAGLLGLQHCDQRHELPGDHLQAGQRGQCVGIQSGGRV